MKKTYREPSVVLICIGNVELIRTSGGDGNQGEWDPQVLK